MIKLVLRNIAQTLHYSKVIKYISPTKTPLGRWGRTDAELKSYQANIDNCGDILCGNAQYTKQAQLSKVCNKRKSPKTVYNDEYLRYFF